MVSIKRKIFQAALLLVFLLSGTAFVQAQSAQAQTLESVLGQIVGHLSNFDFDQAIALFDSIPAPARNASELRLLEASVLSSAGRYADAREIAEEIISLQPENINALFTLAAIEEAAGNQRQQQTALERVTAIDPDNSTALIALGNINLQNRALRPAAASFHRVLQTEPQNAAALIGLSRAFRMNREWNQAEVLLNHAVELYPDLLEARTDRARFLWGRGQHSQAMADMNEAKRIAPNDYWVAIDRANLLLELGMRDQALEEFQRAITLNPTEYLPHIFAAGLLDEIGDHDGAARHYAILASIRPEYYFGLEGHGLHQMRVEDWAGARDTFMEAYRRAPEQHLYALMATVNWMRAEDVTSPRAFLQQVMPRLTPNSLEWHMFRLFFDMTARNFAGERDMIVRLDRERNEVLRARMLFFMGQYYDIRGNTALANTKFRMVQETGMRAIPEWRLNQWILADRGFDVN